MKPALLAAWPATIAALAFAFSVFSAMAQPAPLAPIAVDPADRAASAAAPQRPAGRASGPRLPTPAEKRESATLPGDLRPEQPVTPQIRISIGAKPAAPLVKPLPGGSPPAAAPASGVIDTAARCEAEDSEIARSDCRARARHIAPRS